MLGLGQKYHAGVVTAGVLQCNEPVPWWEEVGSEGIWVGEAQSPFPPRKGYELPQAPIPLQPAPQQHTELKVQVWWGFSSYSGHDGFSSRVQTPGGSFFNAKGK